MTPATAATIARRTATTRAPGGDQAGELERMTRAPQSSQRANACPSRSKAASPQLAHRTQSADMGGNLRAIAGAGAPTSAVR
jgi:hypothetical protein